MDFTAQFQAVIGLPDDLAGVILGVLQGVKRQAGIELLRGQGLKKGTVLAVIGIAVAAGEKSAGTQPEMAPGNGWMST